MSTLSELVAYRNSLEALDIVALARGMNSELDTVFNTIRSNTAMSSGATDLTDLQIQQAQFADKLIKRYQKYIKAVNEAIDDHSRPYTAKSYRVYESKINSTTQQILDREISLNLEPNSEFESVIKEFNDWRFAGLFFRPLRRSLIESMAGMNPLYVSDINFNLLKPSLDRFNPFFRGRMRPVIVDEFAEHSLQAVPDGQLGLIVCLDWFEYKTTAVIEKFLKEFWNKLKPGGCVLFSFNNCDTESGVIMCDNGDRCFTTARELKTMISKQGFELIRCVDESSISWMQIKRSGQLDSLRGGQSLARVLDKTQ